MKSAAEWWTLMNGIPPRVSVADIQAIQADAAEAQREQIAHMHEAFGHRSCRFNARKTGLVTEPR